MPDFDFTSLPGEVQLIIDKLRRRNIDFWLIGGFVRDWVGGCPNHRDIDIGARCNVYKLRGILGGKVVKGRHPLVKTGACEILPIMDIEADLRRRDLTVNAMAIESRGKIIDPFGGRADALAHVLRGTSPDIFSDDAVRLARLCRLAARLGWSIDSPTYRAAMDAAAKLSRRDVVKRDGMRLGLEIAKSFNDMAPSHFFRLAHRLGVLPWLCPPLEKCFAAQESAHLEAVLARCDQAPVGAMGARMAALLMDLAPAKMPQRMRKNAGLALNFLTEMHWDYVATHIYPQQCRWKSDTLVTAIRLQKADWTRGNIDWRAITHCADAGITLDILEEVRRVGFGAQITAPQWRAAQRHLLGKGMHSSGSRRQKMALLKFCGYPKKLAAKIIAGQVIPSF